MFSKCNKANDFKKTYGLEAVLAFLILFLMVAFTHNSYFLNSNGVDPVQTGSIKSSENKENVQKKQPCIIFSDGTSEGC